AGIAAIMLTGRLGSASSNLASPTLVLDVVSACVVGGISVYGGVGKVYGAVFGALFMTLLSNALNAAEVTVYVNQMIRGGIIGRDEGEIAIDGQPAEMRSPIEALERGIAFVNQELNSLPTMTIAENVFADGLPARYGRVDFVEAARRTGHILLRLGSKLD